MKARSLVLIMLFCMMSFTGFGNTTTDLTENSTIETLMDSPDVSISVVATPEVAVDFINTNSIISLDVSENPSSVTLSMSKGITELVSTDQHPAELVVPPDQLILYTFFTFPTPSENQATPATPHSKTHRYAARSDEGDVGWQFSSANRLKFLCFNFS